MRPSGYRYDEICHCANVKKLPIRKYGGVWKCGRCGMKIVSKKYAEAAAEEHRIAELLRVYRFSRNRGAKIEPPDEIKDLI